MKLFTTRKAITNGAKFLIRTHCQIDLLFMGVGAFAYNSGVYGWNCNYYDVGFGIVICEGYRPHGKLDQNLELITKDYIDKIKPIYNDFNIPYKDKLSAICKIRKEWSYKVKDYLYNT